MTDPQPVSGDRPVPEITFTDIGRALWRKLREMKTVFKLLVIIAAGALICAVVPQGLPADQYASRYGHFLANLIIRLQLDHVHTAVWFLALLSLLLLSLVACSGRLWQVAMARWRLPTNLPSSQAASPGRLAGTTNVSGEEALAGAEAAARRRGCRSWRIKDGNGRQGLYVCKHRVSAWGQTLAHYAVFLIALGALLGSLPKLSLDQTVEIQEGDTYQPPHQAFPFAIHIDHFRVDWNHATGAVNNYYSQVRLLQGGKQVAAGTISVNHPLEYHGYYLSQSDWGLGEARIQVTRNGKITTMAFPLARGGCPEMGGDPAWGVPMTMQNVRYLPGNDNSALIATGFYIDAERDGHKVIQRQTQFLGTPALDLTMMSHLPSHDQPSGSAEGTPPHQMADLGWLLAGETVPIAGGKIKFLGVTQTTGLGVRKDSGLSLVWLGFIACIVGLILIFYFPLQRSVITVETSGQRRTLVTMNVLGRTTDLPEDPAGVWSVTAEKLSLKPLGQAKSKSKESANRD